VVKKRVSAKTEVSLDERLLSAAMDVFLERGFAAATVDEIAARAKASKLTFYKHYGNKEALFEAVVKRQNAALLVETIGRAVPEGMPLDRFLEATANRLHAALLKPETVRLLRVLHVEAEHFPQFADIFNNAGPARGTMLIAAELEKNMTRGTMRRADPVLAAEHFLHLALGELTRRILLGLRPAATKAEVSRRIAAGIDVFLRAYGVSSRT
jgi:TetR/AcrR family transcriptional repressor of mexJK operon